MSATAGGVVDRCVRRCSDACRPSFGEVNGRAVTAGLWLALMCWLLIGCGTAGKLAAGDLTLASRDRPAAEATDLREVLQTAWYRVDDRNTLTLVLLEGDEQRPRRAVAVTMFWDSRGGRTPVDRTATNARVHYVDFLPLANGAEDATGSNDPGAGVSDLPEVGVYAGGGFLRLFDDPRDGTLEADLRGFDLRLTDRSQGYRDQLGRAVLSGRVVAERDDQGVTRLMRRLNQRIAASLEYPRLVGLPDDGLSWPAMPWSRPGSLFMAEIGGSQAAD